MALCALLPQVLEAELAALRSDARLMAQRLRDAENMLTAAAGVRDDMATQAAAAARRQTQQQQQRGGAAIGSSASEAATHHAPAEGVGGEGGAGIGRLRAAQLQRQVWELQGQLAAAQSGAEEQLVAAQRRALDAQREAAALAAQNSALCLQVAGLKARNQSHAAKDDADAAAATPNSGAVKTRSRTSAAAATGVSEGSNSGSWGSDESPAGVSPSATVTYAGGAPADVSHAQQQQTSPSLKGGISAAGATPAAATKHPAAHAAGNSAEAGEAGSLAASGGVMFEVPSLDTRQRMQRDRELHRLGLHGVRKLPHDALVWLVQDACAVLELRGSQVQLLAGAAAQAARRAAAAPRLERFLSQVCQVVLVAGADFLPAEAVEAISVVRQPPPAASFGQPPAAASGGGADLLAVVLMEVVPGVLAAWMQLLKRGAEAAELLDGITAALQLGAPPAVVDGGRGGAVQPEPQWLLERCRHLADRLRRHDAVLPSYLVLVAELVRLLRVNGANDVLPAVARLVAAGAPRGAAA